MYNRNPKRKVNDDDDDCWRQHDPIGINNSLFGSLTNKQNNNNT